MQGSILINRLLETEKLLIYNLIKTTTLIDAITKMKRLSVEKMLRIDLEQVPESLYREFALAKMEFNFWSSMESLAKRIVENEM